MLEIHPRQRLRAEQLRCQPVGKPQPQVRSADQRRQRQQQQGQPGSVVLLRPAQEQQRGRQRDEPHRGKIAHQRKPPPQLVEHDGRRTPHSGDPFQRWTAAIDQIMAHVRRAAAGRLAGTVLGQLHRLASHVVLGQPAAAGDAFDRVPVPVARPEIHLRIDARRIARERLLDQTVLADELPPVVGIQEPQAADAVPDRDLVGRLGLPFGTHELLGRQALIGQAMFEPAVGKSKVRVLPLQMPRQLGQERAGKGHLRTGHVRQHQDQVRGLPLDDADHPLHPIAGQVAVAARGSDPHRDAPQILDQRQPQHQRQRPQFAQLERLDRLI